jgi:hypothetical protein
MLLGSWRTRWLARTNSNQWRGAALIVAGRQQSAHRFCRLFGERARSDAIAFSGEPSRAVAAFLGEKLTQKM